MPEENVHIVGDRVLGLDCFPTPGHASHHVCYLDPDGTLYAGDACGVRVLPGRFVMPPTPPPEVDVDAWEESLDEIERRAPERLALIHFGVADDVGRHLTELRLVPGGLGRVGRRRRDRGGVHRVRARPARGLGRRRAVVRPGDAVLAVLPRARALGREARAHLSSRALARHDPAMAGPLRLPDFRYLFAARAISYIGTYLAPIAVAFAILDNGGGATAVGLSFAAWTLAQVAMLAFGGVVGDRVARRTVMIGSDVASTAVRTTMGVLLISGHAQVWQLIALQACGGAAVAFYSPASYGLVREVVPEEMLQKANGLLAIARYAAFPLGAAIGGSIVAFIGSGTALLVDAGTYATSALLLSRIDVVSIARAGAGFFRELREGWSAFVEQTWVWVLVALDLALLPDHVRAVLRARAVRRPAIDERREVVVRP